MAIAGIEVKGWPSQPGPAKHGAFRTFGNIVLLLAPAIFYAFAIVVIIYNGRGEDDFVSWLLEGAKLGATLYPIAFAAVVGKAIQSFVIWRLQGGAEMGLLNFWLASQTAGGAATTLGQALWYRSRVVLGLLALSLWSFSIAGGQAIGRVVALGSPKSQSTTELQYLGVDGSIDGLNMDAASFQTAAFAIFLSAVAAPASIKLGGLDLFGNLKVPMLEQLPANSTKSDENGGGWLRVEQTNSTVYAALLGIPVAGLPAGGTAIFEMTTSYWTLSCPTFFQFSTKNSTASAEYAIYPETVQTDETSGPVLAWALINSTTADTFEDRQCTLNNNVPARNILYADNFELTDAAAGTVAECTISTTYVDLIVNCTNLVCQTDMMRPSTAPHPPSNLTLLDCAPETNGNFVDNFIAAIPNSHGGYPVALQTYFVDPYTPFNTQASGSSGAPPTFTAGNQTFAIRLAQLFNTFWLSGIGASAFAAGNSQSAAFGPNSPNVTATVTPTNIELICQTPWLILLLTSTTVMFSAAISNLFWYFKTHIPDLDLNIATIARNSRYFTHPRGGSYLGDGDWTKYLSSYRVRFGVANRQNEGQKLLGEDEGVRDGLEQQDSAMLPQSLGLGNEEDITKIQKKKRYM